MQGLTIFAFSVVFGTFLFPQCWGQNWDSFQSKHVLNPTMDPRYRQFSRVDWNKWFQRRRRQDFGTKSINSIAVGQPGDIWSVFKNSNAGHASGPDFRWSNTPLQTYVLRLVRSSRTYDVFNCGPKYVLARLDRNKRPLHYQGYAATQVRKGNLNPNLNSCSRIQ